MPVRDNQPPRQPAAPAERDGFTPPTLYTARGAEQPLPQVNGTRQLPPPPQVNGTRQLPPPPQVNGTRQAGAPRPRPAKADPLPLRVDNLDLVQLHHVNDDDDVKEFGGKGGVIAAIRKWRHDGTLRHELHYSEGRRLLEGETAGRRSAHRS